MPRPRKTLYSPTHNKGPVPKTRVSKTTPYQDPEGTVETFQPSEQDRIAIRQAQLGHDVDLQDVEDPRRQYQTQAGPNKSEPHVLPPRTDLRGPRVLERDPDIETGPEPQGRIAEISITDSHILNLDNSLTALSSAADHALLMARNLETRVRSESNTAALHHAEQLRWILVEAVVPWLTIVDQHLQGILDNTTESGDVPEQPIM